MEYSMKSYIEDKFSDVIYEEINSFIEDDQLDIDYYKIKNLNAVGDIDLDGIEIKQLYIKDKVNSFDFEILVEASLTVKDKDFYHTDDYVEFTRWLEIHANASIDKRFNDFSISSCENFKIADRKSDLSDCLVPYIRAKDIENVALEILENYYPEASDMTPENIYDSVIPEELASRLGLSIEMRSITKEKGVLGRLYFESCEPYLYDEESDSYKQCGILERTILIEKDIPKAKINNTIIHECVHYIMHLNYFKFKNIVDREYNYEHIEENEMEDSFIDASTNYFVEMQAKQLTPRIQMPRNKFCFFILRIVEYCRDHPENTNEYNMMETVIEMISKLFSTSKLSAKIRLMQLGYSQVIGACNYIDGRYINPHSFKEGYLKYDETFSIGIEDAAILSVTSPELNSLLKDGLYLFVENHFVSNNPKYLTRDDEGRLRLTDYALKNMHECCLKFKIKFDIKVPEELKFDYYLNREEMATKARIEIANDFKNCAPKDIIDQDIKAMKEANDFLMTLAGTPEECLRKVIKYSGKTKTKIAKNIGVESSTFTRILKHKPGQMKYETLAKMCLYMKLHPAISEKLMSLYGCVPDRSIQTHQWLDFAVRSMSSENYGVIKSFLYDRNVII